ncbi:micronuclear linker histone polyprotein-like [Pseudochaenichthys georgianus]|uniref:micronuclear linker histone polyprotein-like n=1 Tax=Pseudochaenichthys georgianus TaxID=52239 RepID=UPI0039C097F5
MDPERRAQCSELLEHPLFTQDSFHVRFLDELNAKIQKDHRENATLPKITKTPRRERNEGDDRNRRSKEKKQTEDLDERGNKEKERMEKTKGKQPSKLSKTIRNPSEPLIPTKQSKTLGAKIDNVPKTTVPVKSKPGKVAVGDQRKEPEASKSTKTFTLDSLDRKDNNTLGAKQGQVASLETDGGFSGLEIGRYIKSELNQDVGKNWTNTKVLKLSKTSTSDHRIGVYSPKAPLNPTLDRTDASLTQNMRKTSITEPPEGASTSKISNAETSRTLKLTQPSSNDHIKVSTTTTPPVSKPCKTTSGNPNETSTTSKEQRKTSECPKVLPSNSKTSKTTSNSKMTKNNIFVCNPSKTLLSDISRESSTVFREATPVQSTITAAKGTSKFPKTGSNSDAKPTRGLPTDRGLSEISAKTQQDINDFESYEASSGDYEENPESSEPSSVYQPRTPTSKITAESRTTVAIEISESDAPLGTIIPKTSKVSDKENREDLALSVFISSTTTSAVDHISKVEHSNDKSLIGEPKMKPGSFSNRSKSVATTTLKTQKMTFPTEARNKRDIPESKDSPADADSTRLNSTTPDHKALTRSFVFNTPDVDNISRPQSSPPPPPPSSSPLIPSSPVVNPSTSDHFSTGSGFHPGNHSLRCADKSRHHGGVYGRLSNHMSGSLTAQVSDKSQTGERSLVSDRGITATKKKSDVHFPGLRSSGLPEIRGREGKLNRGTSKDQRKPEAQQHGHTSTDSQKNSKNIEIS